MIKTEAELEEFLSRPSEADLAWAFRTQGDFLILGAGGKMGPTLVMRLKRACDAAGVSRQITAVSRFSNPEVKQQLEAAGIQTLSLDLMNPSDVDRLPPCGNVVYMAARKFGSAQNSPATWATNTVIPARIAERLHSSRIVAFSTGNVYPMVAARQGAPSEEVPPDPIGEYGQSALARERLFEHYSQANGTRFALLRLNYAVEFRYGVLLDIGLKVFERRPVDLSMGLVNVIWQGDANSICLRAFDYVSSPPFILNLTGPETLSVRFIAHCYGRIFGVDPVFEGAEQETALLSNAAKCQALFGYPTVSPYRLIEWISEWIKDGGIIWNRPTHFEVRSGQF